MDIEGWIQNDDRNKTLRDAVYAAPVVIRQGSSRAHVDDAINHLKNKISDGSKVLLITNKDSSLQYPFCYGMKNEQISQDFDCTIVDYLQKELIALQSYTPLFQPPSTSTQQHFQSTSPTGSNDHSQPGTSYGISPASASASSLPIAQPLKARPSSAFWNHPENLKDLTNDKKDKLSDIIRHGWFRIVPDSELKHSTEIELISQDAISTFSFGQILAYQVRENNEIRNYYITPEHIIQSLSSESELQDYSGVFYYMLRCPITRQIIACTENEQSKAQPGKDLIQFDDQ